MAAYNNIISPSPSPSRKLSYAITNNLNLVIPKDDVKIDIMSVVKLSQSTSDDIINAMNIFVSKKSYFVCSNNSISLNIGSYGPLYL